MATLPNATINAVPQESAVVGAEYPTLVPIEIVDLVAPPAANRQPNSLETRDETLRDRVNRLVENMNYISSSGPGGGSLYVPRDGSEGMTGDLNLTSTGTDRKVVIDSAQNAYFDAKASATFTSGIRTYVNAVQVGSLVSYVSGGEAHTDVTSVSGSAQHVTITAGATTYDFTDTGATFNQKLTMSGVRTIFFNNVNNYVYADGSNNLYAYAGNSVSTYVATALKLLVGTALTTSYQAVQMDMTSRIQFYTASNYIYADVSNHLYVNGSTSVRLYVNGTEKFRAEATQNISSQTLRMNSTSKIEFNAAVNFIYGTPTALVYDCESTGSHQMYVNGVLKWLVSGSSCVSYQSVQVYSDYRAYFSTTNNYVYAPDVDTLTAHANVTLNLATATVTRLQLTASLNSTYSHFRFVGTNRAEFNNANNYVNSDASILAVNAAVGIDLMVGGAVKMQVTSTLIDAKTHQIKNVVDPTLAQDAATMKYVDDNLIGWRLKAEESGASNTDRCAITVGYARCDFTDLEAAIDYANAQSVTKYVAIYVFARPDVLAYTLTTSKTFAHGISIIGMSGRPAFGGTAIAFSGDIRWTIVSGCTFENLNFTSSGTVTQHGPFYGTNLQAVKFINCAVSMNAGGVGGYYNMYFTLSAADSGVDNLTFEDCFFAFSGTGRYGAYIQGPRFRMEGCTISGGDLATRFAGLTYAKINNCHFVCSQSGVSTLCWWETISYCQFSNVVMGFTSSNYPTYMIYGRWTSCSFTAFHVTAGVYASSGGYCVFEVSTGSSYSRWENCQFSYGRISLTGAGSALHGCHVYCTENSSNAAVELNGDGQQVHDCDIDRGAFNAPAIYATSISTYPSVKDCTLRNTGTSPSILGHASAANGHVSGNMVDVATSGGTGWTVDTEKVI